MGIRTNSWRRIVGCTSAKKSEDCDVSRLWLLERAAFIFLDWAFLLDSFFFASLCCLFFFVLFVGCHLPCVGSHLIPVASLFICLVFSNWLSLSLALFIASAPIYYLVYNTSLLIFKKKKKKCFNVLTSMAL